MRTVKFGLSVAILCAMTASVSVVGPVAAGAASTQSRTVAKIKKDGVLYYGWGAYYPYAYMNPATNRPAGIDIALGEALAKYMGVKLHLVQSSWSTIVAGIPAGRYDVIQPIVMNAARAKVVDYSRPVWIKLNTGIIRASEAKKYPTLASLDTPKSTIDVVLGSAQDSLAPKVFPKAHIVAVQTEPDALLAVLSGRATAMFDGDDTGTYAVARYKGKLAMIKGGASPSYSAFAFAKGSVRFRDYLNTFIQKSIKDGLFVHLLKEQGLSGTFVAHKS